MSELSDFAILRCAGKLLADCGMLSAPAAELLASGQDLQKIGSDGSTRRFWRFNERGLTPCIIAAPAGCSEVELAESRAAWRIGTHLRRQGVPVPELFAWDETTGIILFEDLGDVRLHDIIVRQKASHDEDVVRHYYQATLEHLATMQIAGVEGFDTQWCWDSPRYDLQLMLERESGYFLRAFWQGLLGQDEPAGVAEEFRDIAENAGMASIEYFLHRDFQSRNIMVKDGCVRFIDFQAGRLGPLGYDVASLLIDPYVALSEAFQEALLGYYGSLIAVRQPGSEQDFFQYYQWLALQRNLQIIGAFAFLSQVRSKTFFTAFIRPALLSLRQRLADKSLADYHRLRSLVDRGLMLTAA